VSLYFTLPVPHEVSISFLTRTPSPYHSHTMLTINVVEYDPIWPQSFERIKTEISSVFTNIPSVQIEHVGSTSIPGLAAKPMLDIDIIVPADQVMEAVQSLHHLGYTYAYEANGIDRMAFRYNKHVHDSGASKPTEDGDIRRAVYLNTPDGDALANHLAVREVLRRDSQLREEYGNLKLQLAKSEHADIGAYGEKKSAILMKVLKASDLSEEKLASIGKKRKRAPPPHLANEAAAKS
jgi:GrpB-like predicted nucleotidyltransferase (UPF0157 family)